MKGLLTIVLLRISLISRPYWRAKFMHWYTSESFPASIIITLGESNPACLSGSSARTISLSRIILACWPMIHTLSPTFNCNIESSAAISKFKKPKLEYAFLNFGNWVMLCGRCCFWNSVSESKEPHLGHCSDVCTLIVCGISFRIVLQEEQKYWRLLTVTQYKDWYST